MTNLPAKPKAENFKTFEEYAAAHEAYWSHPDAVLTAEDFLSEPS